MLPKKKKLSSREFKYVFHNGNSLASKSFYLKFIDSDKSCFAVSAPKNIFKKSVERNRVKRRAYSFLRITEKHLEATKKIILVAKENFISEDMENLVLEIAEAFKKVRNEAFA